MNIIVLGGTGYLGEKIIRKLLAEKHHVICLKRETSKIGQFDDIKNELLFCNINQLDKFLNESPKVFDCMINAACKYPRNAIDDIDIFHSNYEVPLNVFLTCIKYDIKKIVTIGTGLPDEFNSYSFSKKIYADTIRWYGERLIRSGKRCSICNIELENFYGIDEPDNRFIPGTIKKLKHNNPVMLTKGTQIRDFIYVEDVVEAIYKIVKMEHLPDYIDFPLGTGEGVQVREVIEYLKEITNSKSELQFGAIESRIDEPNSVADCTMMKKYGIDIRYSWKQGLKLYIKEENKR